MSSPAYFQESRQLAIEFSQDDLEEFSPDFCRLYFLTDREVAVLNSCLRYAEWPTRWEGEPDFELVYTLQRKLMSTCDEITTQLRRIANALYANPDAGEIGKVNDEGIFDNDSIASMMFTQLEEEEPDYTDELLAIAALL